MAHETWKTKSISIQKLETFHNRCLRGIFAIICLQQRTGRISSSQVRKMFGMREMVGEICNVEPDAVVGTHSQNART